MYYFCREDIILEQNKKTYDSYLIMYEDRIPHIAPVSCIKKKYVQAEITDVSFLSPSHIIPQNPSRPISCVFYILYEHLVSNQSSVFLLSNVYQNRLSRAIPKGSASHLYTQLDQVSVSQIKYTVKTLFLASTGCREIRVS